METSEKIAALALFTSFVSLGYSIYSDLRDRSKIKTECIKLDAATPSIRVKAVNVGRRVVILDGFGAKYSDGSYWVRRFESYEMHMVNNQQIESEEHGRQLLEHDYFEEIISIDHDFYSKTFSRGHYPISLWLEDTTGRKYKIKNSEKQLAILNEQAKYIKTIDPSFKNNKKSSRNLNKKQ